MTKDPIWELEVGSTCGLLKQTDQYMKPILDLYRYGADYLHGFIPALAKFVTGTLYVAFVRTWHTYL